MFVDPDKLDEDIRLYYETGDPEAYERIGGYILLIAQRFIRTPRFNRYTKNWRDEMQGLAVEDMLKKVKEKKIDPDMKGTSKFSYLTQACNWMFQRQVIREKMSNGMTRAEATPISHRMLNRIKTGLEQNPGLSLGNAAAKIGCCRCTLRNALVQNPELERFVKRGNRKLPRRVYAAIDELDDEGLMVREIAERAGCSEQAVYQRRYKRKMMA